MIKIIQNWLSIDLDFEIDVDEIELINNLFVKKYKLIVDSLSIENLSKWFGGISNRII